MNRRLLTIFDEPLTLEHLIVASVIAIGIALFVAVLFAGGKA